VEQHILYILQWNNKSMTCMLYKWCIQWYGYWKRFTKVLSVSPVVGKLKSQLYKRIRTQLVLLWYISSEMGKHEHLDIQVMDHPSRNKEKKRNEWDALKLWIKRLIPATITHHIHVHILWCYHATYIGLPTVPYYLNYLKKKIIIIFLYIAFKSGLCVLYRWRSVGEISIILN